MAIYALINKEVIPYVCAGKKVTKEYLYTATKYNLEKINRWLDVNDPTLPTILQAKKLAKCLHIPFAGLYMNTKDIKIKSIPSIRNYRTFDSSLYIDDSSLNIAMCDVLQERDFLIELSKELEIPLPELSLPACSSDDPIKWAKMIREFYSIDISDQFKCSSPRQFYLYTREKLERKGVFVQCFTNVPIDIVRAFSIFEETLPIIGINDEDRPPAKLFSLIHELVHLLKRESSLCNVMYNAISSQKEEVFCNAVAGELLVPREALMIILNNGNYLKPYSLERISAIAKRFSVSREVIIRRLLDCGLIDNVEYDTYSDAFRKEIEQDKEELKLAKKMGINKGIPKNISREAIDRTSPAVCKALYYGFVEEMYSKLDIAQHLGIAQKHVDKFLGEIAKWNN